MEDAPPSIKRFETIQIVAVALALMNGFAVGDDRLLDSIVSAVVVLTLTLRVSRRRKNWPRWVLLAILALALPWIAWSIPKVVTVYGYLPATVAILITLMNGIAVVLLFTPESSKWLRAEPSAA